MRLYQAVVVLLVAASVLTAIQYYVQSIDPETIPEEWNEVWGCLVYIFATSAATPLWTFIRNVYGYAENWLDKDPKAASHIEFESRQLWSTYIKYDGYIKGLTVMMMMFLVDTPLAPYAAIVGGAAAFVVDLIRKAFKDLGAQQDQS